MHWSVVKSADRSGTRICLNPLHVATIFAKTRPPLAADVTSAESPNTFEEYHPTFNSSYHATNNRNEQEHLTPSFHSFIPRTHLHARQVAVHQYRPPSPLCSCVSSYRFVSIIGRYVVSSMTASFGNWAFGQPVRRPLLCKSCELSCRREALVTNQPDRHVLRVGICKQRSCRHAMKLLRVALRRAVAARAMVRTSAVVMVARRMPGRAVVVLLRDIVCGYWGLLGTSAYSCFMFVASPRITRITSITSITSYRQHHQHHQHHQIRQTYRNHQLITGTSIEAALFPNVGTVRLCTSLLIGESPRLRVKGGQRVPFAKISAMWMRVMKLF